MTDFSALKESYLYAPTHTDIEPTCSSLIWAAPIARLLAAGYSFSATQYTEDSCLFRGMESGLLESTVSGNYGHFIGTREESQVERVMDIYFLTHELSDAMTVSELKNNNDAGGILVLSTKHFNKELAAGNAAVMAIGDSGMVFRYPFLTAPITLDDVEALIITEQLADKIMAQKPEIQNKIIVFKPGSSSNSESIAKKLLQEYSFTPATILQAEQKPRRADLVNQQEVKN